MAAGLMLPAHGAHLADSGPLPSSPPAAATALWGHAPSPPRLLRGPDGFRAPIVPVAADTHGALALPGNGRRGGWWALGSAPGAPRGTVLIAGHLDVRGAGPGAFAALHTLPLPSRIELTGADSHTYAYRITARRTYPRQALPPDLFTREGPPRLALVTCTGAYDRNTGGYESNLVLYGTPVGSGRRG
jgi:hypothetical protein